MLVFSLSGCLPQNSVDTNRIALVFDSPVADDAFSTSCLRGAEKAKRELGFGLDLSESTTLQENTELLERYARTIQYNLIIGIGPSHSQPFRELSEEYPGQNFVLVDGDIADRPNVCSLLSRDNESSFLAGALAAMLSTHDQVGFIGGMDIPAINRFLSGYRAGIKYVRPEYEVIVEYSGSWANDGKTRLLALQMYSRGVQVVFAPAGAGSTGMIEAARESNRYAVGVDTDQAPLAPGNVVASAVKNIDAAVYEVVKQSIQGQFKSGIQTAGLKEGGVGLVLNPAISAITPQMKEKLAEISNKIISGEFSVP